MANRQKQMSFREQLRAIGQVAILSVRLSPVAVTFKLIGAIIGAVLPIVTTYFAARTTTALALAYAGDKTAHHQAVVYIALTAAMGLVMTLWGSADNYVQSKMRYMVETRIGNRMYEHFLSLDFWRYDDKTTIDLYDRAMKFSNFYAYVFDRIAAVVSNLIAMATSVIALASVSRGIALFVFVALVPGVWVQFRLSRQQVSLWNKNVESRRMLGLIEWTLTQPRFISELRLYGMVKHLLQRRTELRNKDELERIEIERVAMPLTFASNALETTAEVVASLWIALQIAARKQPLGQFVYVQQLVSRAIGNASSLVSTLANIDEDIANLFDYQEFMELPSGKTGGVTLSTAPQEIALQKVSFRYPGKESPEVLHNVSLRIHHGERVAIVGENGAGKSTLIKLLCGLYQPTGGQILLDDTPLSEVDIASWHRCLGVLQQDFIAYDFATAGDNVRYGDVTVPPDEKRLRRALHDAEANDFVRKLPNGANSYVNNWMEDDDGAKGTQLSGGQWQRLALARDFYRASPIVVLDEPTSAIDALAEARIFERLFGSRDRTVITISHRLSTVKKADVIYMLQDGRVAETGTHDELIAKHGAFYHMFASQIEG